MSDKGPGMATPKYGREQFAEPQISKPTGLRKSTTRLPVISSDPRDFGGSHRLPAMKGSKDSLPMSRQSQQIQLQSGRTSTAFPSESTPSRLPDVPRAQTGKPRATLPREVDARSSQPGHPNTILSTTKTPSLVSGSSVTGSDSPRSALRRKPFTIGQYVSRINPDAESTQEHQEQLYTSRSPSHHDDPFPEAIFGISLPQASIYSSTTVPDYTGSRGLPQSADVAESAKESRLHTLQPALPLHDSSATSSSRYSESPFSHLSTPTSASSYCSNILKSDNPVDADGGISPMGNMRSAPIAEPIFDREIRRCDSPPRESISRPLHRPSFDIQNHDSVLRKVITRKPVPLTTRFDRGEVPQRTTPITPESQFDRAKAQSPHQTFQIPPELAHLNVDLSPSQFPARGLPPRRPSREGIAELDDWGRNLTVVESNLPSFYNSYHKRTPSQETPVSAMSPASPNTMKLLGMSSRNSSRQGSPRVDSAISSPPSARSFSEKTFTRSGGNEAHCQEDDLAITKPIHSPVSTSRRGFFSRRPKDDTAKLEKSEKKPKRGPAAGTGHEGYGRFGFRGRSSSFFGSSGSSVRSPSNDSSTSRRTLSPFGRRKGKTAAAVENSSKELPKDSNNEPLLRGCSSHSSLVEMAGKVQKTLGANARETPIYNTNPTSFNTTTQLPPPKASAEQQAMQIPHSSSDNFDLPLSPKSTQKTYMEKFAGPTESPSLRAVKSTPQARPPKYSNFFQRVRAIEENGEGTHRTDSETLSAINPTYRNLAHYALVEPAVSIGLKDLGRLVAEGNPVSDAVIQPADTFDKQQPPVPYQPRHESYLPHPPTMSKSPARRSRPSPPKLALRTSSSGSAQLLHAQTATSAKSPHLVEIPMSPAQQRLSSISMPRLSSIGRIPPVVSKKDRDRQIPNHSFSRPFAKSQPRPTPTQRDVALSIERASATKRQPELLSAWSPNDQTTAFKTPVTELITIGIGRNHVNDNEFLAFPERKNSDLSYTSSSGVASPCCDTSRLSAMGGEDEVWNEYNDLLNEVMPTKTPASAGSSVGAPFQFAEDFSGDRQESTIRVDSSTQPSLTKQIKDILPVLRLSEIADHEMPSRFSQFLQPANTPSTTFSISDYLVGYGDRTSKALGPGLRHSAPDTGAKEKNETTRLSLPASRHQPLPDQSTTVSQKEATGTAVEYATSIDSNPQSPPPRKARKIPHPQNAAVTGELRFAALMTSKWLSFGRVLFSPAHGEAKTSEDARILILDGLGKEWSYYCALTYPTCQIYNLGSETSTSSRRSVPNHRHIPHPSLAAPFPFPSGFFSAVVFRFPLATYGATYQTAMSECHRVLRPGGYLEVSVLDLDLMNMGTRARKAVKQLKIRIHQADNQISLRNMGDVAMRLLGNGFENIQRCVVGLPVAGRIRRSQDLSSTSSSTSPSQQQTHQEIDDSSFVELLQSKSEGEQHDYNDEGITKMVAKVGRWWYSTCYEEPFVTHKSNDVDNNKHNNENEDHTNDNDHDNDNHDDDDNGDDRTTMWDTPGLLRECERQGTSLRLLICYAQKPTCPRRRTASV